MRQSLLRVIKAKLLVTRPARIKFSLGAIILPRLNIVNKCKGNINDEYDSEITETEK